MAKRDAKGRITYEMTSPGEAWMNYVDSPQGHNAAAVTPSYLKEDKRPSIEKEVQKKKDEIAKESNVDKTPQKPVEKDVEKGREM